MKPLQLVRMFDPISADTLPDLPVQRSLPVPVPVGDQPMLNAFTAQPPKSIENRLEEQFREALIKKLMEGPRTREHYCWAIREIFDRPEFRKLHSSTRDRIIESAKTNHFL